MKSTTEDTEGTEVAKRQWMDGARHGTDVGLELAIKILTEFRDSMRQKFEEAQETKEAK
ncbi:MAG: hypothetical protein KGR46_12010 [Verrucomicrobia bacterium]|nr:hypothetical protein [Verrucomicrobiota bacterium]